MLQIGWSLYGQLDMLQIVWSFYGQLVGLGHGYATTWLIRAGRGDVPHPGGSQ